MTELYEKYFSLFQSSSLDCSEKVRSAVSVNQDHVIRQDDILASKPQEICLSVSAVL